MATVEVYNGPGTELYRSPFYSVSADVSGTYSSVYVYHASAKAEVYDGINIVGRNQYWVSGSYPVMNYLTIGVESSTTIVIKNNNGNISSIDIGPHRLNKQYTINNNLVTFDINKNENLFIIINNNTSCPIMTFANPPKPPIPASVVNFGDTWTTQECIYFGPGVHDIGFNFSSYSSKILSGVKLYLDGGAYLKGSLMLVSSNNVSTIGPGVLSCEDWYDTALSKLRQNGYPVDNAYTVMVQNLYFPITARFDYSASSIGIGEWGHYNTNLPSGIYVDGITIVKFPAHGPKGLNTSKNLKIISPWNWSTDGPVPMPDKSFSPPISRHDNMFIINADDCVYIGWNQQHGNVVYSSCYYCNNNNGPYAVYGTQYLGPNPYWSSSINIDVRMFDSEKDTFENGNMALFKLTMGSNNPSAIPPNWGNSRCLFSSIHFEGLNYTRPFFFGNANDPFGASRLHLSGVISGFLFHDITVSCIASAVSASNLSGLDSLNKPQNFLFHNVVLNGVTLTEANKDSYFTFSGSVNPTTDNIRFTADFPTNMKISPIKLLN